MFSFLTSSSITRLYRGLVPRLMSDNFTCCQDRERETERETEKETERD